MRVQDQLKDAVRAELAPLTGGVSAAIGKLTTFAYPPAVTRLDFEIFPDSGFPVRVFFMDADNCEYFTFVEGRATYPSPIAPELFELDHAAAKTLVNTFLDMDEGLPVYEIIAETIIAWFAECWKASASAAFALDAAIALHDSRDSFDLRQQRRVRR